MIKEAKKYVMAPKIIAYPVNHYWELALVDIKIKHRCIVRYKWWEFTLSEILS